MGALFLGVLGGIFFGLFSCGGYVWHKRLFYAVFAVVEAPAACFYLDNPTSLTDFKKEFLCPLECEPG